MMDLFHFHHFGHFGQNYPSVPECEMNAQGYRNLTFFPTLKDAEMGDLHNRTLFKLYFLMLCTRPWILLEIFLQI